MRGERLRVVHPRVSLETCECYGIRRISQVVREVLDKDFTPEPVQGRDAEQVRGCGQAVMACSPAWRLLLDRLK